MEFPEIYSSKVEWMQGQGWYVIKEVKDVIVWNGISKIHWFERLNEYKEVCQMFNAPWIKIKNFKKTIFVVVKDIVFVAYL